MRPSVIRDLRIACAGFAAVDCSHKQHACLLHSMMQINNEQHQGGRCIAQALHGFPV